jgi:hypothetical protein
VEFRNSGKVSRDSGVLNRLQNSGEVSGVDGKARSNREEWKGLGVPLHHPPSRERRPNVTFIDDRKAM